MASGSSNKIVFVALTIIVVLIFVGGFIAYKKFKKTNPNYQAYNTSSPVAQGSSAVIPTQAPNAQNSNNQALDQQSSEIDSSLNSLNSDLNNADQQLNSQTSDTAPAPVQ